MRFRWLPLPISAIALASCSHPVPLFCDEATACTDPDRPFCDLAGEFPDSEGIGNTCIPDPTDDDDDETEPVACSPPGEALRCEGNLLIECTDDSVEATSTCPLGCLDLERRCIDIAASNGLEFKIENMDLPKIVLADRDMIDTSGGEFSVNGKWVPVPTYTHFQTNGPPIQVFLVESLSLPEGIVLVIGESAFAVLSREEVTIGGVLYAAGEREYVSPGAFRPPHPCTGADGLSKLFDGIQNTSGSGGGSNATPGGRGGTIEFAVGGGIAGDAFDNPDLVPLHGGCSGGGAYFDDGGGEGGGAIQIVSRKAIRVLAGGSIDVSGEAGWSINGLPGGGGSGGGVLLEAPIVEIAGNVFANGGGGACLLDGGTNGRRSDQPAPGGSCSSNPALTDGGAGAALNAGAQDGGATIRKSSVAQTAGGGGGGAGYIVINTKDSHPLYGPSSTVSPFPYEGRIQTF